MDFNIQDNLEYLKAKELESKIAKGLDCNICGRKFTSHKNMRIHQGHSHFKNF